MPNVRSLVSILRWAPDSQVVREHHQAIMYAESKHSRLIAPKANVDLIFNYIVATGDIQRELLLVPDGVVCELTSVDT